MSGPAAIGHNQPPEPTPFEAIEYRINDLYAEAKQWLDGDPVTTQGQADMLNLLIVQISMAEKEADTLRKDEAKPYDDAKAEIQTRYSALIGNTKSIKGKTVLALAAAKSALTPWLKVLDDQKREAERIAREKADAAREVAETALRQSRADDLAAREEAERLLEAAKTAERAAVRAEHDKAHAKGGPGRATGLRTYYTAEIADARAFARFLWARRRPEMDGWLQEMATKLVTQNHNQQIPGITIHENRKAV